MSGAQPGARTAIFAGSSLIGPVTGDAGQDRFLADHGFGRATAYLLIYGGRSYDSKAILGVAYKFATGLRLRSGDFSGGIYGAASVLRKLGFEVRNVRSPAGQE